MKRNRSLFLTFLILAVHLLPVTAFEWPQGGVTEKSFAAVFGQLRGHNFSSSLVFTEPAEIAAIESKNYKNVIQLSIQYMASTGADPARLLAGTSDAMEILEGNIHAGQ